MTSPSPSAPRKILVIFGTRPEAIKMLPVVRALRTEPSLLPIVVTTGQHREMLDQVFRAFGEHPDVDLDIMSPGQTLTDVTIRVLKAMEATLREQAPDLVLVHGDTTTAMAASTAAFYAGIPIGHVEAGLRSHDPRRPWPEEFNRIAIDAVADLLFAPTQSAADILRRESPRARAIHVTGNTGIDALLQMRDSLINNPPEDLPKLAEGKSLILVTGHRRESFGQGFEDICEALDRLSRRDDVQIIYPVHLNPAVKEVVFARLGARGNVQLVPPVGYAQMVFLMNAAKVILTDSGGVQEEAPALGKPVLVMRDVTERPEALATGVASLVGTNPDLIVREISHLLDDADAYAARARPVFPYGDGQAAARIVSAILTARVWK